MPRALAVGNGNMLVNVDKRGLIHDFYFPYVGMEDHTTFGHYHRVGIYEEEGKSFTWLTDDHWRSQSRYLNETMVGETTLTSDKWQLEIRFIDFVHPIENVFCRKVHVKDLSGKDRKLRMFFCFDFHLYGLKGNDTVYYSGRANNLIFYKYNRYVLVNAESEQGGIKQYATGKTEWGGLEGTWKDAEDGVLSGHPIEQGSVDAAIALHFTVPAENETELNTWICAAESFDAMQQINTKLRDNGFDEYLHYTTNYWRNWVNKQRFNFTGVTEKMINLFKHSLLIIRTQIDNHGAIIAANDTDIMKFNKDTYSYMWPRDGAFVTMSLDNTGYSEITKRFFQFCNRVQTKEGFMMHKYNPDGSLGSSWHPWLFEGKHQVPLQEDETALPIIALRNHYERVHDIEFIQRMYDSFVLRAANFLFDYRDKDTGLPLPSYDPWEEEKGVFTYTCSTVYQGLISAAELAAIIGHKEHQKKFHQAAEEVKDAIIKYLFCPEEECFVKKIRKNKEGEWAKDYKADASVSGIWLFGVLPADDSRVVKTMRRIKEKLSVKTEVGGLARYENDRYHADHVYPPEVPGNPWIITTLWYAQWLFTIAEDHKSPEFKEAEELLTWATNQATSTNVLPEQINPYTGEHLSVAPLTWSHATYVDTIMLYRQRLTDFGICEDCMIPTFVY